MTTLVDTIKRELGLVSHWRLNEIPGLYSTLVLGETGLQSYWRLGELSGTTAADSKGANTGTYSGGYTLGQTGALPADADKAVLLNGSSGYVNVPDAANLRLTGDLTFEAWVNPTDHSNYMLLLAKSAGTVAGPYQWYIGVNGFPNMYLSVGDGNTESGFVGSPGLPALGVWSHVAVTVSGTTITHYINGVAIGTTSIAGQARADNGAALQIGRRSNGLFLKGNVDEVAVYNSALSAAQIARHYQIGIAGGNAKDDAKDDFGISPGKYIGPRTLGKSSSTKDLTSGAVLLNGSYQYATVPNLAALNPTVAVALEAWVFQTSSTGDQYVVGKNGQYWLGLQSGAPAMTVYVGGTPTTALVPTALTRGWHHLCGTYGGNNVCIYVDGVLMKTAALTGAVSTTTNALEIGRYAGANYFNGLLSEVAFYSVALSAKKILYHFNVGRQILPDLAHSRSFDPISISSF